MTQKVLSIKVEPNDFTLFKAFAKGYKTQAEAFSALMQLASIPRYTAQKQSQRGGIPNMCVFSIGTKLELSWELKKHLSEKYSMSYKGHKRDWYIFPEDRVVAIWNKSANGAKSWLEVAAQYPEAVWLAATKHRNFSTYPLTTLQEYQTTYARIAEFAQLPIIAEALEKGWAYEWTSLRSSEDILIEQATKHLKELAESISKDEPVSRLPASQDNPVLSPHTLDSVVEQPMPEVSQPSQDSTIEPDSQVVPMTATNDELIARFKTNPNLDKGQLNSLAATMKTIGGKKLNKKSIKDFTTSRDPDGLEWQPVDATKLVWRQVSPVLAV
ncbi:MAG: hypothetical protein RM049_18425 [Nostoc sp. DedQUE04]|uniref:hypothetical protein n=1 Tax=Nostoc sp. DedQUE04 TaxID=3075390 RepID=UPI002AD2CBA0|nr:hypothetical protein [Nostoc sp. DedQUE04]MDZ8137251.1 hypothetical protein [Nostoc sp. DedQUE04]